MPLQRLHDALVKVSRIERRLEPPVRDTPGPLSCARRSARSSSSSSTCAGRTRGMKLAEERIQPGEEEATQAIIDLMREQMRGRFKPGGYERGRQHQDPRPGPRRGHHPRRPA